MDPHVIRIAAMVAWCAAGYFIFLTGKQYTMDEWDTIGNNMDDVDDDPQIQDDTSSIIHHRSSVE